MDLSSALVDAATIVAKDYSLTLVLLPLVCLSCPSSLSALKSAHLRHSCLENIKTLKCLHEEGVLFDV